MQTSNSDKHLNLCFTHVSTGYCPYGVRCSFIHDPRISSKFKSKVRTKNLVNNDGSNIYWPKNSIKSRGPNTKYYIDSINEKDKSTKLMWNNFIDFIQNNCKEKEKKSTEVKCKVIIQNLNRIDNKEKKNI